MSSKQNIEDIFHEGLGDFTIEPSGKVWSGINKQMTGPRLEASCRNAFDGFKVDPSKFIWRRVAAALWFQKFINFTPFSFNVYYLAIITTAIVGTVITVNNSTDLGFKYFDENNYKAQNSDSLFVDNSDVLSVNNFFNLAQVNNYSKDIDGQIVGSTTQINDAEDQLADKNVRVFSDNPEIFTKKEPKTSKIDLVENKASNNSNTQLVNEAQNSQTIQLDDKEINKDNSLVPATDKNIAQQQLVPNSSESIEESRFARKAIPAKLLVGNSLRLFYSPQWYEIADNAFVGIPKYDEIVKDTIGYNYLGEPVVVDKSWLEIGAFYSTYLYGTNSILKNNELVPNYEVDKNGVSPQYSWGAGLSISYNFNRFRVESGLSFLSLNESFSQLVKAYDTLIVYSYDHFTNSYWDVDTTMILDLDEYLLGNIVYITYLDSVSVQFADSLMISSIDSVLVNNKLTAVSNVRYIEMPLIGGYEFAYGKFAITPKAGLICGMLTYRGGTGYNVIDGKIVTMESMPLNKIIFDYYGAINLQYRLGEHFSVFVEPHIRGSINSAFKESYPISSRSVKYGLRTGISYRF